MAHEASLQTFDPYDAWFQIPPTEQPPDHYRLLGLSRFEQRKNTILNAYEQRMQNLRSRQNGPHAIVAERLKNELTQVMRVLSDDAKRAEYDRTLTPAGPSAATVLGVSPESGTAVIVASAKDAAVRNQLAKRSQKRQKSPMRQFIEVVLGGVLAIPLTFLILHYGFNRDPLGIFVPREKPAEPASTEVAVLPSGSKPPEPQPAAEEPKVSSSPEAVTEPQPVIEIAKSPTKPEEPFAPTREEPPPAASDTPSGDPTPQTIEDLSLRMQAMPVAFASPNSHWRLDGDDMVTEGTGPETQVLLFGDPSWTDYDLKVDAMAESGNLMAIVFQSAVDGNSYWSLDLGGWGSPTNLSLLPYVAGEDALHHPGTRLLYNRIHGTYGTWYSVVIQVRGSKAAVFVDGSLMTESEHPKLAQGRVGIRKFGSGVARWRNCEVRSPDGQILWTGWPDLPIVPPSIAVAQMLEPPPQPDTSVDLATVVEMSTTAAEPDNSPLFRVLEDDFAKHEKAVAKAKEAMLEEFQRVSRKVRDARVVSSSDRVAMLQRLQEEQATFEKSGFVPFSQPMREATVEYLRTRNEADQVLAKILDMSIAAHLRAKDDKSAGIVSKEKDRRLAPQPMARWRASVGTGLWVFYSDGHAVSATWSGPWRFNTYGFVITWSNPQEKKVFIDSCTLNALGNHFDAKNQDGLRFVGDALGPE